MSNIETRVKRVIVEQLGVDEAELKNEASFDGDLGAGSVEIIELIWALGEEFNTDVPSEEADNMTTVQAAIDYFSRT